MQKILSAFFAFVLIIGSPVNVAMALGGGTYYVDASTPAGTGDGSLANPWTTISEAVAVAASGDTVNVASRLESSGEQSRIAVSHETYELTKDVYKFEDRGSIDLKGKGLTKAYFLLW